jgi:3-mercaptopyruvate sulfurtransferase SseA
MKNTVGKMMFVVAMSVLIGACSLASMATEEVPLMTTDELRSRLDKPDTVILDVRAGSDWTSSDQKISGAVRCDPKEFSKWSNIYPKKDTIVLYCA